jgi:hypothetical protein
MDWNLSSNFLLCVVCNTSFGKLEQGPIVTHVTERTGKVLMPCTNGKLGNLYIVGMVALHPPPPLSKSLSCFMEYDQVLHFFTTYVFSQNTKHQLFHEVQHGLVAIVISWCIQLCFQQIKARDK